MLMNKDDSVLLVVDMQERLLPVIHEWQRLLDQVIWLVQVAQKVGVPVLPVELYRLGLGETHAELRAALPAQDITEKIHFSCVAAGMFAPDQRGLPGAERRQVVVCGIEAHVCVLQTALELREQGRAVFVVADAVASRDPSNKQLALERLRGNGVDVVSCEMVAYEWLRQGGTPLFREINSRFLR